MIRFIFHPNEGSNFLVTSVVVLGERSDAGGIIFREKPSFSTALYMTEHSPPYNESIYIPMNYMESIYFHTPFSVNKIKFQLHQHSLKIIESDLDLSPSSVFHVFKYILFKRGNSILYLTNGPNEKIRK
jgi:hypothetical protein